MNPPKLITLVFIPESNTWRPVYAGDDRREAVAALAVWDEPGFMSQGIIVESAPPARQFTFPLAGADKEEVLALADAEAAREEAGVPAAA